MVILSKEVENVLDRIFLVGVAYDGTIPLKLNLPLVI